MLLSARCLGNVANVNSFRLVDNHAFTEGDAPTLYFQLVDLNSDPAKDAYRYVPAVGATLQVQIVNCDSNKTITRSMTQPFATDGSVWALTLQPTDALKGTYDIRLTLVENGVTTRGMVRKALRVYGQTEAY